MSMQEAKANLLENGYTIQFTLSLDSCRCSICHPSWVSNDIHQSVALPTGEGADEAEALQQAMQNWSEVTR